MVERLKVMPELMLAADWSGMTEAEMIKKIEGLGRTYVYVSRKFDGVRVIRKDGRLLSKYGKEFPHNEATKFIYSKLYEGFEGEFYIEGGSAGDAVSAIKTGQGERSLWRFHPFDSLHRNRGEFEHLYEHYAYGDVREVVPYAFKMWGQGGDIEGFMINATDRYIPGRMPPNGKNDQIFAKWKPLKTMDVPILSTVTGKKGLGSIVCRCPNTGMAFEVGTGFTDADREVLMNSIGATVEVAYRGFLKDGRPKFPSFKQIKQGV